MIDDYDTKDLKYVDATGLICPVPLVLLKKAVESILPGSGVLIEVTDIHAELDFEIWCERFGHTLSEHHKDNTSQSFIVSKSQIISEQPKTQSAKYPKPE